MEALLRLRPFRVLLVFMLFLLFVVVIVVCLAPLRSIISLNVCVFAVCTCLVIANCDAYGWLTSLWRGSGTLEVEFRAWAQGHDRLTLNDFAGCTGQPWLAPTKILHLCSHGRPDPPCHKPRAAPKRHQPTVVARSLFIFLWLSYA